MLALQDKSGADARQRRLEDGSHAQAASIGRRLALGASLVLAAGLGAFAAEQLRPARQVVTALSTSQAHVPVRVTVPVAIPAAPSRAMLGPSGGPSVPLGAWLRTNSVTLSITLRGTASSAKIRAEAEVLPAFQPFTGTPNVFSQVLTANTGRAVKAAMLVSNLADGRQYHWRVRTWSTSGQVSQWRGGGVFGISVTAPTAPQLAATNVRVGGWSTVTTPLFRWVNTGSHAPVSYHEYRVTRVSPSVAQVHAGWVRLANRVLVLPNLTEGSWRVELRAVDRAGNQSSAAAWEFGLARHAPPAPAIMSASPLIGAISNAADAVVTVSPPSSLAPIARYEYATAVGADAVTSSLTWRSLSGTTLALPGLSDAGWQVFIRAVDVAGNVSAPVRWQFTLDREHPLLTTPTLSSGAFTEPLEAEHLRLGLGKKATITFAVFAAGSKRPIAVRSLGTRDPGVIRGVVWDGKIDKKRYAPVGSYHIVVDAVDGAGNRTQIQSAAFTLLNKRIFVSISKDALWAYEGKTLVTYSLVTNGSSDTPTIPGIYHVQAKDRNFVFHSPWPKSSPLYYPPSPTNFALLYNADGGYFLHDAPWRWNFGPGSNSVAGLPGSSYTGTHGCTNVPYSVMAQLYSWADVGTLIQIVP